MRFHLYAIRSLVLFWLRDVVSLLVYYRLKIGLSLFTMMVGVAAITAIITLKQSVDKHAQKLIDQYKTTRFIVAIAEQNDIAKRKINFFAKENGSQTWKHNLEQLLPYSNEQFKVQIGLKSLESYTLFLSIDAIPILQWKQSVGRTFHPLDNDQKVVVMGNHVAQSLRTQGIEPLHQYIKIHTHYFKVIGILEPIEFDPLLDFDVNKSLLIDLKWLFRLNPDAHLLNWIVFSKQPLLNAQKTIQHYFENKFNIRQIYMHDLRMYHQVLMDQINSTLKILEVIAAITLSLGLISILNLLFVLLNERKYEIGLRLALGATAHQIGFQFLREFLFLNLLSALMGLLLGQTSAGILSKKLNITLYWSLQPFILVLGMALGFAVVIGIIPAWMAAKKKPFEMLQG